MFCKILTELFNEFDLKPIWIQVTRIWLDNYIIFYDNLSVKWILCADIDFISKLDVMDFALKNMTQRSSFHQIWPRQI